MPRSSHRHLCAALLSAAFFATVGSAQDPVHTHAPVSPLYGGYYVAGVGDLDDDGTPDYAYKQFDSITSIQSVVLISGATHVQFDTIDDPDPSGGFGWPICSTGDITGDGVADLAIAATQYDDTANGWADVGQVRIYDGATRVQIDTYDIQATNYHANARFGEALTNVGDIDGDGVEDLLVGARRWQTRTGWIELWSGATGTLLMSKQGPSSYDWFGTSFAACGDVDGNGTPDLAIGATGANPTTSLNDSLGAVFVCDGLTGVVLPGFPIYGPAPGSKFGSGLATIDANHDGKRELVVGAPNSGNSIGVPPGIGSVYVYDLETQTLLDHWLGVSVDDRYGTTLGGVGDLNGDGVGDVLITSEEDGPLGVDQGRVEIRSGATGMVLFNRRGPVANSGYGGYFVGEGLGDLNGDGLDDWAVCSTAGGSFHGVIEVFHGFTPFQVYEGENSGDQFGHALAKAGDLNGDGVTELLVGAPELDTSPGLSDNVGGLYIVDGRTGDTTLRFQLGNYWDYLGSALAVADFDLDGFNDFVIGANGMEQPGAPGLDRGGVIRLSGNPANAGNPTNGEILPRLYGAELGDNFGSNVIVIGDVNGDGVPEYAASSPNADPPLGTGGASWQDAGTVTVFDGATGNVHLLMNPPQQSAQFGRSIAGSPDFDFNNDGTPDFAIGAPTYQQLIGGLNQATGAVFVYSGDNGTQLAAIFPATPNSKFGSSIALLEDVNGDGFDDIAIGSPDYSGGLLFSGRVQLFLGFAFPGLPLEHWQIVGAFTNQLGGTLAAGGDWDGDSDPDIIASATGANLQGNNTGAVWILDAATGTKLHVIDGKSAGSKFGNSASFVGDLDGDGRDDLLVGDQDQQSAGSASLIRSGQSRVQSYGIGCGPAGLIPTLTGVGTPTVGSADFALKTDNAYPGGLSLLFIALTQTAIPIGNCTLFLLQPVSIGGYTSFNPASPPVVPFGIPNNAALVGMRAYFQGVVVHPGAPFLNLGSLTNGVEATIGS